MKLFALAVLLTSASISSAAFASTYHCSNDKHDDSITLRVRESDDHLVSGRVTFQGERYTVVSSEEAASGVAKVAILELLKTDNGSLLRAVVRLPNADKVEFAAMKMRQGPLEGSAFIVDSDPSIGDGVVCSYSTR
jgi:hypothetical protein